MQKKIRLFTPRNLNIVLIQCLSIAPFVTAINILNIIVESEPNIPSTLGDIIILLFAFIFPLFLLSFFLFYFPQRYRNLIIIDLDNNMLHKIKKNKPTQNFDISTAKSIISKTIRTSFYCKYHLIFEDTEKNLQIIFDENTPLGTGQWDIFSEKLSIITGLPLNKVIEDWLLESRGSGLEL